MSFVKTLATLAIGFAAARGYGKYKEVGGMPGVKEAVKKAGEPGGAVDQWGQQAEKLGLPGGAKTVREMYERLGGASEAAEAGLGGLIASMTGAATAGGKMMGEMMETISGASPASAMNEENAKLMIRAMIQAAKADGKIDADEKARIMEHLGDIDARERAFIEAEMAAPVDAIALATDTSEQMKAQVYATSLMAVRVDDVSEAKYLNTLADALGLSQETRDRVHRTMGVA